MYDVLKDKFSKFGNVFMQDKMKNANQSKTNNFNPKIITTLKQFVYEKSIES